MKKDLIKIAGIAIGLGVLYLVLKNKKEEKKSSAEGVYCNKNRSNKPCLDWVIGKGWTNIKK